MFKVNWEKTHTSISLSETRIKQMVGSYYSEKDIKSVHTQSSPAALGFYKQRGFKPMPFKDPDGYESSPDDSAMGKVL